MPPPSTPQPPPLFDFFFPFFLQTGERVLVECIYTRLFIQKKRNSLVVLIQHLANYFTFYLSQLGEEVENREGGGGTGTQGGSGRFMRGVWLIRHKISPHNQAEGSNGLGCPIRKIGVRKSLLSLIMNIYQKEYFFCHDNSDRRL